MKRHGCALYEDGAQRAASNNDINVSSLIGLPVIALGDQRLRMYGAMSCVDFRCCCISGVSVISFVL